MYIYMHEKISLFISEGGEGVIDVVHCVLHMHFCLILMT